MKLKFDTDHAHEFRDGEHITPRTHKVAKLFRTHQGRARTLLDIGCGTGTISMYLAGVLGAEETCGIDVNPRWVEQARATGVNATVLDIQSDNLPYDDDYFDAIFCGELIEHLTDTDHLLDQIFRALSPGGCCVLTTPNLSAWHNRIALFLGFQPFGTGVSFRYRVGHPKFLGTGGTTEHVRVFTYRALVELLRLHGFLVLETVGIGIRDAVPWPSPPLAVRAIGPVDTLFSRLPSLSAGVAVAIRKPRGSQ
jgi:SAM-dependent methyltransferase